MTLDGAWTVDALAVGGELVPPLAGTALTVEFKGDRVCGHTGVNSFQGSVNSEPPLFGPLATTLRTGSHEHMAQEDIMLRHLRSIDSYERLDGEIHLVAGDLVVIILKRSGTNRPVPTSNS